ncbi:hypothetical protein [Photobacterium kishitanii]|uniref:Uncharacterized protein n=1 Tax=Photobacterium kishitanii TaxID=318456 RepID=A0A2T3KL32_9GAMM|nr:hypothetical protein [Photobacterium kishitanii]PSV00401.1 hypothetical protein C9J27_04535 [Photobacterium kishitanii]
MSILKKNLSFVWNTSIVNYIEDNSCCCLKEMTANDVVSLLFSDRKDCENFQIVRRVTSPEQKWFHRLNTIWVFLLSLVCAPYKYVRYGFTGWDHFTPFGEWILSKVSPIDTVTEHAVRELIATDYYVKIDDLSAKEVIEYLFGDFSYRGDFMLVDRHVELHDTWWQRFNVLWIYPLALLCYPYRYIRYGDAAWDRTTKFGRWLHWMVGSQK